MYGILSHKKIDKAKFLTRSEETRLVKQAQKMDFVYILSKDDIISAVLESFEILKTSVYPKNRTYIEHYSRHSNPSSAIGQELQALITEFLVDKYPTLFRAECDKNVDADIVCLFDDKYSLEVKTTGNKQNNMFTGNGSTKNAVSKVVDRVYLFVKYSLDSNEITNIWLGYVGHNEWTSAKSNTQRSTINPDNIATVHHIYNKKGTTNEISA